MNSIGWGGDEKCLFFNCWVLMLCFAQTWQFVQCWYTDFFMPFQWYLFFKDAYVLLNPLWPCLSCARIRRQSLRMSGTTMVCTIVRCQRVFALRCCSPSYTYFGLDFCFPIVFLVVSCVGHYLVV